MHKAKTRLAPLAAALLLAGTTALMTACDGQGETVVINDPIQLPLEEKATLSYWMVYDNTYAPEYTTLADHPFFQWMEEKTNIHVEFVHPTDTSLGGARQEYINRVAAGALEEDMVTHSFFTPELSGPTIDSAVEDGFT